MQRNIPSKVSFGRLVFDSAPGLSFPLYLKVKKELEAEALEAVVLLISQGRLVVEVPGVEDLLDSVCRSSAEDLK